MTIPLLNVLLFLVAAYAQQNDTRKFYFLRLFVNVF